MEEKKSKKFLRVLIGLILLIIIVGVIIYACAYFASNVQEFSEPITVTEKQAVGSVDSFPALQGHMVIPPANAFFDVSNNSGDYKYIYYDENDETKTLYAMPKDELEKIYSEAEPNKVYAANDLYMTQETNIIDSIENGAIAVIEKLTKKDDLLANYPVNGEVTIIGYDNTGLHNSAFYNLIFIDGSVYEGFKSQDLVIRNKNVEVVKVIGTQKSATELWGGIVIVSADLTVVKNNGQYKKLNWMPKPSKTEKIYYVVTLQSYVEENGYHKITVEDIGILNTTPSMIIKSYLPQYNISKYN